jgi:glycine/D-amino acid oxidase-like deaminating enzyme
MRTTDDNRLLIGGEDEDFVTLQKEIPTQRKVDKLTKYLKKILPDYDFRMDFVWAGTFGDQRWPCKPIGLSGAEKNAQRH